MPPLLALAPLAASAAGAELLPLLGGALGGGELLGGAGLFGATLGETLGGVLGGGAAGALTNEDDPLLGGLLGAAGGAVGGAGLANGIEGAVGAGADALGLGASGAAGAASAGADALAGGAGGLVGGASPAATGAGAAAIAAPDALGGSSGLDNALSGGLSPSAGSSAPGATLEAGANDLAGGVGGALSTPAAPANTFETLLSDPSWKNLGSFAGANKDLIKGGLSLGATALQGDQQFPGEAQLRAQAKQLSGQASSFMRGELTPGMQAGLRGATESAKAAMRSMFAQRGMSGSSSEVEALASIDQTAAVKGAEIAQSLIRQGVQESQLAGSLWQTILQASLQRDNELGSAIGNFASSLAGGQRAA